MELLLSCFNLTQVQLTGSQVIIIQLDYYWNGFSQLYYTIPREKLEANLKVPSTIQKSFEIFMKGGNIRVI